MSYYRPEAQPRRRRNNFSGLKLRMIIAGGIMLFAVISYYSQSAVNPVTGEKQRVNLSVEQETQMGLQALPTMVQQHNGLSRKTADARFVESVGARLLNALETKLMQEGKRQPYSFDFHLLADAQLVNAFALPGGQVFITEALLNEMNDEGQLAGVLGHEIGHVLERHSAERMTKTGFYGNLARAAGVAGGDMGSMQAAQVVSDLMNKKFGRDQEYESDKWGLELMVIAGYDPRELLAVMDILQRTGGGAGPSFLSTHPNPADRKKDIQKMIDAKYSRYLN